jgi:hypothetical protein
MEATVEGDKLGFLRPGHTFVGEFYVDELMDGQAFEMLRPGGRRCYAPFANGFIFANKTTPLANKVPLVGWYAHSPMVICHFTDILKAMELYTK